jgi:hypothetical protein
LLGLRDPCDPDHAEAQAGIGLDFFGDQQEYEYIEKFSSKRAKAWDFRGLGRQTGLAF